MTKTLIDIAKEQGAKLGENWCKGYIAFTESQLKATIYAYNAQVSEPFGYVDIQYLGDGYRLIYVDDNTNSRYINDRFLPLYTTPQTIPPAVAEYIERLEHAAKEDSKQGMMAQRAYINALNKTHEKEIVELEAKVAKAKQYADDCNMRLIDSDHWLMQTQDEKTELQAHTNRLREAIEDAFSSYEIPVTARIAEALSETPVQSLKAHDDELLDKHVQSIYDVGGKRVWEFVDAVKSVSDSKPSKEYESMS